SRRIRFPVEHPGAGARLPRDSISSAAFLVWPRRGETSSAAFLVWPRRGETSSAAFLVWKVAGVNFAARFGFGDAFGVALDVALALGVALEGRARRHALLRIEAEVLVVGVLAALGLAIARVLAPLAARL